MIARKAIMPHLGHPQQETRMTLYLISLPLAGLVAIAEIIRCIPPPDRTRKPEDCSMMLVRSVAQPDDLTMDHCDEAPCEYVWSDTREE
jgi:hypothetical protein